MAINNNTIYTGSKTGELFIWSIPANTATFDPYDTYDASLSVGSLEGHTNAVWSMVILNSGSNATGDLLCTASADSTIKIWDTSLQKCIKTIELKGIVLNWCVMSKMVVSFLQSLVTYPLV